MKTICIEFLGYPFMTISCDNDRITHLVNEIKSFIIDRYAIDIFKVKVL